MSSASFLAATSRLLLKRVSHPEKALAVATQPRTLTLNDLVPPPVKLELNVDAEISTPQMDFLLHELGENEVLVSVAPPSTSLR